MLPPGPRTPALWQTYRFITQPRAFTRGMVARYGEAARFKSLIGNGIGFFTADLAREVFGADPDNFETSPNVVNLFGREALLATFGAVHRRQRKLLNPRFHGARIKGMLETIQRVAREHLDVFRRASETGAVVSVRDVSQALTLDVILETVFGASVGLDRARAREVLIGLATSVAPSIVGSTIMHAPWFPPWRRFVRQRAGFDAWADALIVQRRATGALGADILGTLLEARYEDGVPMADSEIRDQLMTLLLAGYETTATAVAWGVYWLLREPATLSRLRTDIDALGPDRTAEALVRQPYLEAVASEALRVEPIVTDVMRVCKAPLDVGRWTVPAGEIAVVNLLAILSDENLFPDPGRFVPERFLERRFSASEFLPFGGGARRCLGAAFAEAELVIVLGTIAAEWDVELASGEPERAVRRNITMGPERGVPVRVRGARKSPQAAH
jgi:cytochrome P450